MVAIHVQEMILKLPIALNQVSEIFTDISSIINWDIIFQNIIHNFKISAWYFSVAVLDNIDLKQYDNGLSSGFEEGGFEFDYGEGSGSLPECDVTGI